MSGFASETVGAARRIIEDARRVDLPTLRDLVGRLKSEKQFPYARDLLAVARERRVSELPEERRWLRQQHALCTYKNTEASSEQALSRALEILSEEDEDLATTTDQETLGIAGAIHKRMWDVDGQRSHLRRAFGYYERGRRQGVAGDAGYTAINAAFLLDVLTYVDAKACAPFVGSEEAVARAEQAAGIRREILATLGPRFESAATEAANWWALVTLAEAALGLGQEQEARRWLDRARSLPAIPEWQLESTARQLAQLVRIQHPEAGAGEAMDTPAMHVVRDFLGEGTFAALAAYAGKVGLALSGGGFRASFFHLGVLARLADLDLLRYVEVLSCVSGGSILGAHYHLELRHRLQTRPEAEMSREEYIDIVHTVAKDFLAGVQKNLRMRTFTSPGKLIKGLLEPGFNRTVHIGELYEELLYARVADGAGSERLLCDTTIQPEDEADFHPRRNNWRRQAKVPMLVLNATTLNTGHNWQFTSTFMGEPPGAIEDEIDANYRLRRVYLGEAPGRHGAIRLGAAVAASACVPGLFRPVTLKGLYPEIAARLVDGGVQDNQGIFGLLDQDCDVMIVSDASGQMEAQDDPAARSSRVPLRANSILQATIRAATYRALGERQRSRLRELVFVHLKQELEARDVDAIGMKTRQAQGEPPTSYGIPRRIQALLANVRTDLDSFTQREAFALMLSGYRILEHELPKQLHSLALSKEAPFAWDFFEVEQEMDPAHPAHGDLLVELEVARHRFFKPLRRSRLFRSLRGLFGRGR